MTNYTYTLIKCNVRLIVYFIYKYMKHFNVFKNNVRHL